MRAIIVKDIVRFFSSLVSVTSLLLFYLLMGLVLWVFPDYSVLNGYYSSLETFFTIVPMVLMFLIPALNMNALSQEIEWGTIDLLLTRPVESWQIVLAKYLSGTVIIAIGLLPSLGYAVSVYFLGNPIGNIDLGGLLGSYIGLFLLCFVFTSISLLASSLLKNNISALITAIIFCFLMYWGWYLVSSLPFFYAKWDYWVQWLGLDFHYAEMGKGLIRLESILYFISLIIVFLGIAILKIENLRK